MDYPDKPPPPESAYAPPPPEAQCHWHKGRLTPARCASCGTAICQQCATPITGGESQGHPVCPTCAPGAAVEPSVPWESSEGKSWSTFWRTFFMPYSKQDALFTAFPDRPLGRALGFAVLAAIPSALVGVGMQALQTAIGLGPLSGLNQPGQQMPPEMERFLEQYGHLLEAAATGIPIVALVFVPLAVLLYTLMHHVFAWKQGARHDLTTTMRIVCYLWPLSLLASVPVVGPILWFVFWMIGMKSAMQRVQGLTPGSALLVAFAPLIFGMLLGCCCVSVLAIGFIAALS